jgi:alkaline phosphatase D
MLVDLVVPRPRRPALGAVALACALLLGAAHAARAADEGLLVAVGEVSATDARLWVRGVQPGVVAVELRAAGEERPRTLTARLSRQDDLVAQVALEGLASGTRHAYRVRQGEAAVTGEFATAPPPGSRARVTFLWSGDLGGGGRCRLADGGYRIFRAMRRHPADFFLFVGDTAYTDIPCRGTGVVPGASFRASTLGQFRAHHRYNRADPAFQEFLRRTPVYAVWDDHEVRDNFAGPTEPLAPVGLRAFLDYWPVASPRDDPTRLYRRFRWGALLEVFILDTRQYRSDNAVPDGPGKTMLGAAQRQWLVEGVAGSTATWKVVVSSVPLSIPSGRPEARDSWSSASVFGLPQDGAGFATERDAILRRFRERGVRNLVFVTGDVHHAELIRHHPWQDFSFHEFVAGPLSASWGRPRPLDQALGPRSLFARGGVSNFGEVTIEPEHLTVRIVDEAGAVLFTHTFGPE